MSSFNKLFSRNKPIPTMDLSVYQSDSSAEIVNLSRKVNLSWDNTTIYKFTVHTFNPESRTVTLIDTITYPKGEFNELSNQNKETILKYYQREEIDSLISEEDGIQHANMVIELSKLIRDFYQDAKIRFLTDFSKFYGVSEEETIILTDVVFNTMHSQCLFQESLNGTSENNSSWDLSTRDIFFSEYNQIPFTLYSQLESLMVIQLQINRI